MVTIYYNLKRYHDIPESYNELSGKQFVRLTKLLESKMSVEAAAVAALFILTGMSIIRFILLPADMKQRMLSHVDWVFERNGITRQLLPSYRVWLRPRLYGPADEFDNLTMGEWNACEIFYAAYVNDKDPNALDKLVAVLYRKPKEKYKLLLNSDGDIRQKFNPNEIDYRAKHIVKWWSLPVKKSILAWFDGCRENLKACYDLFDEQSTGESGEADMFQIIRGLCGQRYGGIKEVEEMNVHLALRELELMKKEAKELENMQTNGKL